MKKTPFILFVTVAVACAAGLIAQQQGGRSNSASVGKPNPVIVAKLREIVAIREQLSRSAEVQVQAGRMPADNRFEVDLVEARLQLAREENRADVVAAELRNLISAHQGRLKRIERLAMDRLAPADVARVKVDVLEAEIRLLREPE